MKEGVKLDLFGMRHRTSPLMIACGGALMGTVMGFGESGAIIGGLIALWAGIESQKGEKKRDSDD